MYYMSGYMYVCIKVSVKRVTGCEQRRSVPRGSGGHGAAGNAGAQLLQPLLSCVAVQGRTSSLAGALHR